MVLPITDGNHIATLQVRVNDNEMLDPYGVF